MRDDVEFANWLGNGWSLDLELLQEMERAYSVGVRPGDDNISHWPGNAGQAIAFHLFLSAQAGPGNVVAHLPL